VVSKRLRVILDCDPGNGIPGSDVDDGLAFGYLASIAEIDLLGVTVVAGNTAVEDGYDVARSMVAAAGRDVPVIAGSVKALVEDPAPWIQRRKRIGSPVDIEDLWKGVPRPSHFPKPPSDDAPGFIIEQACRYPGEVHLVAVGPLTNVAQALQRCPQLAQQLASIHVMGGAFGVPDYLQELNFAVDPEAAEVVMGCGANLTLVPLDVTLTTTLTLDDVARWQRDDRLVDYLARTTRPWIEFTRAARGRVGCPLHDPLAAVALVHPELIEVKEQVVAVELRGSLTRARPVAWTAGGVRLADGLRLPERRPVRIVTRVENARLVETLAAAFAGRSAMR
jgi:inosine-uridine nucleoside N-ribohydrolase